MNLIACKCLRDETICHFVAKKFAAFKDPVIHALYERKRAEGKDHMTVIGHVCRKMISIIFAVLRDNTPYVPAVISD